MELHPKEMLKLHLPHDCFTPKSGQPRLQVLPSFSLHLFLSLQLLVTCLHAHATGKKPSSPGLLAGGPDCAPCLWGGLGRGFTLSSESIYRMTL